MPAEVHKLSFLHVLASVVLVIGSLYWARAVFVPLALSLMLTFLLQPVVALLHRRGLGYAPAVVLVVLLLALLIGAALAYYTTFSLAPLLVIVIAIAALVFGQEAVQGKIVTETGGLVDAESASAIQTMIEKARTPATGIFATILSLIALLLGATGVVGELKDTLNTIWHIESAPEMGLLRTLKTRLTSLAFVLGVGFLLLASL